MENMVRGISPGLREEFTKRIAGLRDRAADSAWEADRAANQVEECREAAREYAARADELQRILDSFDPGPHVGISIDTPGFTKAVSRAVIREQRQRGDR
jgi:hypothetical protein